MKTTRYALIILLLFGFAAVFGNLACGDDDDDNDDNDTTADDDDATDDDDAPDDDDATGETWEGDQTVFVMTPTGQVEVELNGLPTTTYTDPESKDVHVAVNIQDVVDQASFDSTGYKFYFIATDDFNALAKSLDGDFRPLPEYTQLAQGWFIEYEEEGVTDIEAVWDEGLGYSGYMFAKMMDGGTIAIVENILFDQNVTINVDFGTVPAKAAVNLNGLPAFYDGDGDLSVWAHHVILEAALDGFDPKEYYYAVNFIANDGYSLLDHLIQYGDDVLDLPWWKDYEAGKDVHNGWIKNTDEDGYRVFWAESTGFSGSYSVGLLENGTIEVIDITDLVEE